MGEFIKRESQKPHKIRLRDSESLSIYNGGNGGAGGREHIILKHKDGTFEEMDLSESMDLSEDINEKYQWGLWVSVGIGDQENLYKAYCPYLDDTIEFSSENAFPFESQYAEQHGGGGNCRGFLITDVWNIKGKMRCNAWSICTAREELHMP